jgi:hypothetical protein
MTNDDETAPAGSEHAGLSDSFLFTLRFWPAVPGDGRYVWRGKLQAVGEDEPARHFRDWPGLIAHLETALARATGDASPTPGENS